MWKNVLRRVFLQSHCPGMTCSSKYQYQYVKKFCTSFEPPYLDKLGPQVPVYNLINVQFKGYDFTVLESYTKYIHKIALNIGADVKEVWATPCRMTKVQKYKPNSTILESEYELNTYERNIQLLELPTHLATLLIEQIQSTLPTGVQFAFLPHEPEHLDIRLIPDLELEELQKQLQEIVNPAEMQHNKKNK